MDPILTERGTVSRGEVIGLISDKGSKFGLAHGPHLHFAISSERYSPEDDTAISPYWVDGPLSEDLSLYTYDAVELCQEHILSHLPQ